MSILVLGLGNILLSDEGVGVRIVEALEASHELPADVEVLDGGTSGMDLLDMVAERDCLIVADAVNADGPAGRLIRLEDDNIKMLFETRFSPHQLGLSDLLAALRSGRQSTPPRCCHWRRTAKSQPGLGSVAGGGQRA